VNVLSVTQLNNQIKAVMESTFERVSVEGEVSNITYHTSGHLYFSIKDKDSAIKCVMFRGNASRLKFRIETGMHLVCEAAVSVYTPRGEYQLNCFSAAPAGEGALALAYEQLKKRLMAKGYFESERKRPMPRIPGKIALITSATGAAVQDMLKVAAKRWPMVKINVYNTVVQGEKAGRSIAGNIALADRGGYDVMVVGRGGGSMEDLWGFNEEVVADAIFTAITPVVSAVGHEVDYVISDFVADLRAPTPSAAMEMLLPDQNEVRQYLDTLADRMGSQMRHLMGRKSELLGHMKRLLISHSVSKRLELSLQEAKVIQNRMRQMMEHFLRQKGQMLAPLPTGLSMQTKTLIRQKEHELSLLNQKILGLDPSKRLLPHTAQVVKNNVAVDLSAIQTGERFRLTDGNVSIDATADKVTRSQ